jgi:hypothetical protein
MAVDWRNVMEVGLAMSAATGLTAGMLRWIFAPRVTAWWHRALGPVTGRLDTLDKRNTSQHQESMERDEALAQEARERWGRHERVHDELGRAIGRLEGGQQALLHGAEQLPRWPKPTETT